MHITLESDYAVRIIDRLVAEGRRMDAKTLAGQTGVTPRFTLKILHKLTAAGLITSYKGAKGGYELARSAKELTLRDVIETVEGPYAFSRCLSPDFDCRCDSLACRQGSCRFQRVYDEVTELVRQKLQATTFADLGE